MKKREKILTSFFLLTILTFSATAIPSSIHEDLTNSLLNENTEQESQEIIWHTYNFAENEEINAIALECNDGILLGEDSCEGGNNLQDITDSEGLDFSDNFYESTGTNTASKSYVWHKFTITPNQAPMEISAIKWTWEGNSLADSCDKTARGFAKNQKTGSYEIIFLGQTQFPWIDATETVVLSNADKRYVDGDGKIELLVQDTCHRESKIKTDFIELQVGVFE